MIFRLFRRHRPEATIRILYGAIVAQARLPGFYLGYGVPDTVAGRFDMIVLHQALFFRRLGREPADVRKLSQGVFDLFCRDMDHNLREMGVGDLAVPKEMRRLAGAFYGRVEAYDRALGSADFAALAATVSRNVLSEAGPPSAGARRLAAYVRAAAKSLDREDGAAFLMGTIAFPDPDTIPADAAA